MTGKAKLETLTNAWYGFAVFSALFAIWKNGIGFFSIGGAVVGLFFSWILTWFIGRALVKKSSVTRLVLLLASGIFTLLGVLAVGQTAWSFVRTWEFGLLSTALYSAVSTWMYARSWNTLTDSSVKSYFG